MTTTNPLPNTETDNWESTPLEAPRQQAGVVLEKQSEQADAAQHSPDAAEVERQAAEAEALAQRQATTDDGSVASA